MLNLSVVSTKETHITFASIVLMTSLFLCTSAYAETTPNTNADSQIITTTPITTKNYPPITPVPLSSSLMSKTHELAATSIAYATSYDQITYNYKKLSPYNPCPFIIKLDVKNP